MSKHSKRPYMFRWLFMIQDDPSLSRNAKTAAVPIFRHADVTTGKRCYVGAETAAGEMGCSRNTILRGWRELAEAGWLNVWDVNRGTGRGADRWARFPEVSRPEGSSESPRGLVEAESFAPETSPHSSGSVSRATDGDAVSGDAEKAGDEATRTPCKFCGDTWANCSTLDAARQCGLYSGPKQPPIGHRDDWELRNA